MHIAELHEPAVDAWMEHLPTRGDGRQVVARLSRESRARPGPEIELSMDTGPDPAARRHRCPAR